MAAFDFTAVTTLDLQESLLEPLQLRNAGEQIADRLVTAIALGVYVPGQRLPVERDLALMLGVSRGTLREALQRLSAAGYVEVRRGRNGGAYVLSGWQPQSAEMVRRTLLPVWSRLEGVLDFRQLIERLIARVAAERRTDDDDAAIRTALAAYQRADDDREASRAADEKLHRAIAEATHNPYLVNLSTQLRSQVSFGLGAEPYTTAVRGRALRQHDALAEAVIAGRAARAGTLAAEHFSLTESALRDLVDRADGATPATPGREPRDGGG
jgi:GntR family transcriptional regulator, transcriptional repressor for pyruvate dehydrogenase complex